MHERTAYTRNFFFLPPFFFFCCSFSLSLSRVLVHPTELPTPHTPPLPKPSSLQKSLGSQQALPCRAHPFPSLPFPSPPFCTLPSLPRKTAPTSLLDDPTRNTRGQTRRRNEDGERGGGVEGGWCRPSPPGTRTTRTHAHTHARTHTTSCVPNWTKKTVRVITQPRLLSPAEAGGVRVVVCVFCVCV